LFLWDRLHTLAKFWSHMLALWTHGLQIQIKGSLQFLNIKPDKFRLFLSFILMGALCMLLLDYGTAFQLSYTQLHLSKLVFLLRLILHSNSSHCLLFFMLTPSAPWLMVMVLIFMSSALEFHYLENKHYKSN
jgi:hypothetical protein